MERERVWVVTVESGSYSSYNHTVLAAYASEDVAVASAGAAAITHVEHARSHWRKAAAKRGQEMRSSPGYDMDTPSDQLLIVERDARDGTVSVTVDSVRFRVMEDTAYLVWPMQLRTEADSADEDPRHPSP